MAKSSLLPAKANVLERIFRKPKPIIGVIHLQALPGAPRYSGAPLDEIYQRCARDAQAMAEGGVDGVMIENAFDVPYARPEDIGYETVAGLTGACLRAREVMPLPIGVTCVANGVVPGLAVAKAVGGHFVRANQWAHAYVAPEGLINGPAGEALRYRSFIRAEDVAVFADVQVKYGAHAITADRSISDQAKDAEFFDADVLIVTGSRTGDAPTREDVERVKQATSLPVLVGSGMGPDSVQSLLDVADGAIVGASLKEGGQWWRPVELDRVLVLMEKVDAVRSSL